MLLNRYNYPILGDIEKFKKHKTVSHSVSCSIPGDDKLMDFYNEFISLAYQEYEILKYSSKIMSTLIANGGFHIVDDNFDLKDLRHNDTGIFLVSPRTTYIYSVEVDEQGVMYGCIAWITDMELLCFITWRDDVIKYGINPHISFPGGELEDRLTGIILVVTELSIFKLYAPIEREVINRERRKIKINSEKYKNELELDITVIDSSWYTELLRTEGFGVSGHFRLQPCGKGHKDRKLIWVKAFKKSGYHRRARRVMAGFDTELN